MCVEQNLRIHKTCWWPHEQGSCRMPVKSSVGQRPTHPAVVQVDCIPITSSDYVEHAAVFEERERFLSQLLTTFELLVDVQISLLNKTVQKSERLRERVP